MIFGDALGSPYEFGLKPRGHSHITDDTLYVVATLKCLALKAKNDAEISQIFKQTFRRYENAKPGFYGFSGSAIDWMYSKELKRPSTGCCSIQIVATLLDVLGDTPKGRRAAKKILGVVYSALDETDVNTIWDYLTGKVKAQKDFQKIPHSWSAHYKDALEQAAYAVNASSNLKQMKEIICVQNDWDADSVFSVALALDPAVRPSGKYTETEFADDLFLEDYEMLCGLYQSGKLAYESDHVETADDLKMPGLQAEAREIVDSVFCEDS
jgi:hypothetical protein